MVKKPLELSNSVLCCSTQSSPKHCFETTFFFAKCSIVLCALGHLECDRTNVSVSFTTTLIIQMCSGEIDPFSRGVQRHSRNQRKSVQKLHEQVWSDQSCIHSVVQCLCVHMLFLCFHTKLLCSLLLYAGMC